MPIYMDRHDNQGATQQEVAEAHNKDLALQGEYGVNLLTYWVDADRGTTFCLVDSPTDDALIRLHTDAHGGVPNKIIPVARDAVEMFLGRVEDPPEEQGGLDVIESGFRAIMFTDLTGFTALTVKLGDTKAMELLRLHNEIVREALGRHGGREVKHTGDGLMASFPDPVGAVRASSDIQRRFAEHNEQAPDEQLHVRVGVTVGEPVEEAGDLFGSSVQLAARLCDMAQPGQVLVDEGLVASIPKDGPSFEDAGTKTPKGFEQGVQVYAVDWRG